MQLISISLTAAPPEGSDRSGPVAKTLLIRRDEVETAWELVTPILQAWGRPGARGWRTIRQAARGSTEADRFIQDDGHVGESVTAMTNCQ